MEKKRNGIHQSTPLLPGCLKLMYLVTKTCPPFQNVIMSLFLTLTTKILQIDQTPVHSLHRTPQHMNSTGAKKGQDACHMLYASKFYQTIKSSFPLQRCYFPTSFVDCNSSSRSSHTCCLPISSSYKENILKKLQRDVRLTCKSR